MAENNAMDGALGSGDAYIAAYVVPDADIKFLTTLVDKKRIFD